MKKILFIGLLSCLTIFLSAQGGFRSRVLVPGALNQVTYDVFEISPGKYIGAGLFVKEVKGQYKNSFNVLGLDGQGKVTWVKEYEGDSLQFLDGFTCRRFIELNNYFYHCGVMSDSANRQFGTLCKFDSLGNMVWQKFYFDTMALLPYKVAPSVDGGFLLTGYYYHNNETPGLVLKTDANGNELWRTIINNPYPNVSEGRAIVQDSASKQIVVAGMSVNNSLAYSYISVLDSLGNMLSQERYYTGLFEDLIQTNDKKFVACGGYEITGFAPKYKAFAMKFDMNKLATPLLKIFHGQVTDVNHFTVLTELDNGQVLIGGTVLDTVHPGKNMTCLNRFIWVDEQGQIKKEKWYDYAYNDSTNQMGKMTSVNLTSDGGWIASVRRDNPLNRDFPYFFVKYDSTGCDSTTLYCENPFAGLSQTGSFQQVNFVLSPNPASASLKISGGFDEKKRFTIKVTDISGKAVTGFNGHFASETLDISKLQEGLYFVNLYKDSILSGTRKLLIQR